MGPGEQAIINAFMEKELEDEAAERKKIEDMMKTNKNAGKRKKLQKGGNYGRNN